MDTVHSYGFCLCLLKIVRIRVSVGVGLCDAPTIYLYDYNLTFSTLKNDAHEKFSFLSLKKKKLSMTNPKLFLFHSYSEKTKHKNSMVVCYSLENARAQKNTNEKQIETFLSSGKKTYMKKRILCIVRVLFPLVKSLDFSSVFVVVVIVVLAICCVFSC